MTTNNSVSTSVQMLSVEEVAALIGVTRSTIYDWMNVKSKRYNASFPKKIKIGPNTVRWVEKQLVEWLQAKISAQ